jgi:hypothetical protein
MKEVIRAFEWLEEKLIDIENRLKVLEEWKKG